VDIIRQRRRGLPISASVAAGVAVLIAVLLWILSASNSRGGGPLVEKSTLVTDVAIRGTLVRSVSAQGTFTPDRVRIAAATQSGVVNQIFVKPGSAVSAGTIIAQMQNPSLDAAALDARSQLAVAQADLASARQQARAEQLTQQTVLADAQAQMEQSTLQAHSLESLHHRGLVADVQYQQAIIASKKNTNDVGIAQAQLTAASADAQAKVAAAQARVEQAAAQLGANDQEVAALTVRSASSGIVQSIDVDPGTSVAQNAVIARIADTASLKAVLQIAEGDIHAVTVGMLATIDTGNGSIPGRVSRIAPSAENGTVATDVAFAHPLPPSLRPDTNVDGTIRIASIRDALSIARPAGAADGGKIDLFKVVDGATRALRVRVQLGQGSSDRVQVLSGLAAGDVVIVSDMSSYLDQTTLRLR
jgi:HlyD family secretion protein